MPPPPPPDVEMANLPPDTPVEEATPVPPPRPKLPLAPKWQKADDGRYDEPLAPRQRQKLKLKLSKLSPEESEAYLLLKKHQMREDEAAIVAQGPKRPAKPPPANRPLICLKFLGREITITFTS